MGDRPAGKRILIVDDEEFVRRLVAQVLTRAGYKVDFAAGGEAALAGLAARRPDLVILDLMMPGMNGWTVLERMRAEGDTTPVIVLTAHGSHEGFTRAVRAGAAGYISKPFSLEELLLACARALASGAAPGRDRRQEARRTLLVRVRVTSPDAAPLAVGQLVNIGLRGGQVDVGVPLATGQRVRLMFEVLGGGRPMPLDAQVEWQQPAAGRYLHGLVFRDLPPETEEALGELLHPDRPPERV